MGWAVRDGMGDMRSARFRAELSFNAMCTRVVRTCMHVCGRRPEICRNVLHSARRACSGVTGWGVGRKHAPIQTGHVHGGAERVSNAVNCACSPFAHRGGLAHWRTGVATLAARTRNAKINDFHHKMQIIRVRASATCSSSGGGRVRACVCVCIGVAPGAWKTHNCKYRNPSARCAACRNSYTSFIDVVRCAGIRRRTAQK